MFTFRVCNTSAVQRMHASIIMTSKHSSNKVSLLAYEGPMYVLYLRPCLPNLAS